MASNNSGLSNYNKWKYTLITTFIFLVVTNPVTYVFVNSTIGKFLRIPISDNRGCPTIAGLLVHAIVFTLILRAVMG